MNTNLAQSERSGGQDGTRQPGPFHWKKYLLFMAVVAADLALLAFRRPMGIQAVSATGKYFFEMLGILPPVFILVGLLDVWVPRSIVENNVGEGSGIKGMLIALLAGSAAAGPLYGAFPVADMMLRKGCTPFNALVFLGAWAGTKIPLVMTEARFLGPRFALMRLVFTLPAIIAIAWMADKLLKREKAVLPQNRAEVSGQ